MRRRDLLFVRKEIRRRLERYRQIQKRIPENIRLPSHVVPIDVHPLYKHPNRLYRRLGM